LADPKGEIRLGEGACICRFAVLQSCGGIIEIGNNSLIGDFCNLYGHAGLRIGANVMVAAGCRLVPEEHTFDIPGLAVSAQPTQSCGISIADGAWLGANVVVLDGVRIGKGAVIGAGAVVTKDIPDYAIAVGVPAKVTRMRPGSPPAEAPSSRV
jgi:acetyltransferase-like isoleucine patch superfamily enzyme